MKKVFFAIFILTPFIIKAQLISTVAGNGVLGYSGDGLPATTAKLHLPGKIFFDGTGNLYISDSWGHRVRKVDVTTGIINTIAGTGTAGYNGDGIAATSAQLNDPCGLAFDAAGNLYIADIENNRVRKIDHSTGIITTFAGNGVAAFAGDSGPATSASLYSPGYITFDATGNLYISDGYNFRIRKVNVSTGIITTIVGNGYGVGTGHGGYNGDGILADTAELNWPQGITIDATGNLYIADDQNNRIRKVDAESNIITSVAGNGILGYTGDSMNATSAEIEGPFDIAFDAIGNFYIAEFKGRIRMVDAFGIIHTVAGDTVYGYNGDGIPATTAELNETTGIALDACGSLYIADVSNERIRKITFPPILTNPAISLSGITTASVGTLVTITATVTNAGSSYNIEWFDNGVLFNTTTVPSVTYTKTAGTDTITARVVPTGYGCYDSTTSSPDIITVNTEGVSNVQMSKYGNVQIYPNPAHDVLHIDGVTGNASLSTSGEGRGEAYRILSIIGGNNAAGQFTKRQQQHINTSLTFGYVYGRGEW